MSTRFFGNIKVGIASVSKPALLLKTADNTPDTGKLAAALTAYYYRQGASATTSVSLSDLGTLNSAFSSGGVKEIGDGAYRVDWPDAAWATGADWVLLVLKDSTTSAYLEVVALETSGAADNAAAITALGSPLQSGPVTVGTNNDKTGYSLSQSFPTNFASLSITTGGAVTATGLRLEKDTALNGFPFAMVLSSDHVSPATGKTVTAQRSINGGAFTNCTNSPTEVGLGIYVINLAAADTNGDTITYAFSATGCDTRLISVVTQTP